MIHALEACFPTCLRLRRNVFFRGRPYLHVDAACRDLIMQQQQTFGLQFT